MVEDTFLAVWKNGVQGVASFGQDQLGELYALTIEGGVYKLVL